MKKILIIIGGIFLLFVLALFIIPVMFKGIIKEKVQNVINENLNATVHFSDVSVSFFRDFPNVRLSIDNIEVLNHTPFEGDTLFSASAIHLSLNASDIFKSSEQPYRILGFDMENATAYVHINKQGEANYNITQEAQKPKETPNDNAETTEMPSFDIQQYQIKNMRVVYIDDSSEIKMVVDSLYHLGSGHLVNNELELSTVSKAQITAINKGVSYLNKMPVSLDAVLGINLQTQTYTFKNNIAKIVNLPLIFNGSVQILESSQKYDISFETPTSAFDNFLMLIPPAYLKSVEDVQTQGEFFVKGGVNGELTDKQIPKIDIQIQAKNAQFKYPSLPKSIEQIAVDAQILNTTGKLEDTSLKISNLGFKIDEDIFNAQAKVTNITTNPRVAIQAKGILNLANIAQAYPVSFKEDLKGVLNMDFQVDFDMKSIENNQYQKVNAIGTVSLSDMKYNTIELPHTLNINSAKLNLNFKNDSSYADVTNFQASTGETDINFSGRVENLYGFLFGNQNIKGDFLLKSNFFSVNDFLVPSNSLQSEAKTAETKAEATTTQMKIPSFLDCNFKAEAKQVAYSTFRLKNASGILIVKNESVHLKKLNFELFDGTFSMDAVVSTQKDIPSFSVEMDINKVDIPQSFSQIEMLKSIAPIANIVQGGLSSKLHFSSNLNTDFTPDINTLSADIRAKFSDAKIKDNPDSPLLKALSSQLKFLNVSQMDLNKLNVDLSVNQGRVIFKPFQLNIADASVQISGTHGLDQSMDYQLTVDLPSKYLGSEVGQWIAKLPSQQQKSFQTVSLPITVKGSLKQPVVQANVAKVSQDLTQKLIESVKQSATEKGLKALNDIFSSKKDDKENKENNTEKNTKETAKKVIEGLFNL